MNLALLKKLLFTVLFLASLATVFTAVLIYKHYFKDEIMQKKEETFYCGTASLYKSDRNGKHFNETGYSLFTDNCSSCHDIHEKIVGPPLKDITRKRKLSWLRQFIRDSEGMIRKKDRIAVKVSKEYKGMAMTNFEYLSPAQVDSILDYIQFESVLTPLP